MLAERGYHGASTNRIAAQAGISPGTLYGYFADKDEIVEAVLARLVDGFGDALAPALREAAALPLNGAVRLTLDAVQREVESRVDLIAAVTDRVPPVHYAGRVDSLRELVTAVAFQLVTAHRPAATPAEIESAVWATVRTVEHLTVRYAIEQPPIEREAWLDQLTAMVLVLLPPE